MTVTKTVPFILVGIILYHDYEIEKNDSVIVSAISYMIKFVSN